MKVFLPAVLPSPGQAGDGIHAPGPGEPLLCADPQGPGSTARQPNQPDRLPLPPQTLHRGRPWGEAGVGGR